MKLRGLLVVIGAAALLLGAQPASTARSDQTYNDPQGDAQGPGVPDITLVTAQNSGNVIAMRAVVANQPTLNPDSAILIYFDTDRNPATGQPGSLGADFLFLQTAQGAALGYWNGVDWADAPATTGRAGYQGGVSFVIDRSELGNTRAFNFRVLGVQQTPSGNLFDSTPNDGTWAYELQAAGATITSMRVYFTPLPARAGRMFTARVVSVLLSTNQRVRPGSFRCSARIGSRSFGNRCRFRVPRGARGSIRVTFTATYRGASRTSTFTVPIRP